MEYGRYIYNTEYYTTDRIRPKNSTTRPPSTGRPNQPHHHEKYYSDSAGLSTTFRTFRSTKTYAPVQLPTPRLKSNVDCVNTEREGDSEPILMRCPKIRRETVFRCDRW